MATYDENKKELSPCIVSKAKYALGLKSIKPTNNKTCSLEYWEKVVAILSKTYPLKKKQIAHAIEIHNKLACK
ncbi:MAG: hypothetical protein J7599_19035 [Niabella sp.]|nr:hypothetical protein [Niabella sp.]